MTTGYFDLQVNGYGGLSFRQLECLTVENVHDLCANLRDRGYAALLPTITTDPVNQMAARLQRLASLRNEDPLIQEMVVGFHIEGPFLNPGAGYCGAHRSEVMQAATPDTMQMLLDAADGMTRLVTLAPECDPGLKTVCHLVKAGVTVSAGHCNSSLDQLRAAIDVGLSMFTHLGNACPIQFHRHDNIVQRALFLREHLWLCFIADGVHVNYPALSNYLALAGLDRAIIVSDASPHAGMPPGRYRHGHHELLVDAKGIARTPDGYLIGSGATLDQASRNLRHQFGFDPSMIDRFMHTNPQQAIGLDSSNSWSN